MLAYRLYKIDADDDRALIEARNYVDAAPLKYGEIQRVGLIGRRVRPPLVEFCPVQLRARSDSPNAREVDGRPIALAARTLDAAGHVAVGNPFRGLPSG